MRYPIATIHFLKLSLSAITPKATPRGIVMMAVQLGSMDESKTPRPFAFWRNVGYSVLILAT